MRLASIPTPAKAEAAQCAVSGITKDDTYIYAYINVTGMLGTSDANAPITFMVAAENQIKTASDASLYADGKYYLVFRLPLKDSAAGNLDEDAPVFVYRGNSGNGPGSNLTLDDLCWGSSIPLLIPGADKIDNPAEYDVNRWLQNNYVAPQPSQNSGGSDGQPPTSTSSNCMVSSVITKDGTFQLWFAGDDTNTPDKFNAHVGTTDSSPTAPTAGPGKWSHRYGEDVPSNMQDYAQVWVGTVDGRSLAGLNTSAYVLYANDVDGTLCKGAGLTASGYTLGPCDKVPDDELRACQDKLSCINSLGIPLGNSAVADIKGNGIDKCMAKTTCQEKRSEGFVFAEAFYAGTGSGCYTLETFIATILNYIMLFATLIAGFMFAKGMFGILVSRGNPTAVADAREMLTNAVIGLVLLATAFLIIKFLGGAFGAIPGSGIDLSPIIKPAGY